MGDQILKSVATSMRMIDPSRVLPALFVLTLALTCSSCGDRGGTSQDSAVESPIPTAPSEEPKVTLTEIGAGIEDEAGWVLAKSSTAGFTVLLPGKYNDFQQSATSQKGNPLTTHHVGMVTPAGVRYSVTAFEGGDPRPPGDFASDLIAGSEKTARVENRREFELDGSTGTQYDIISPRSRATTRVIEHEGLLYMIIAEYPPDAAATEADNITKFLTSFRPKPRTEEN